MQEPFEKIAVLGAGSFGTAIAHHLANLPEGRCGEVMLYGRRAEVVGEVNSAHLNSAYLPGWPLAPALTATTALDEELAGAGLVVLAIPAQHLRGFVRRLNGRLPSDVPVLDLAKGIESDTLKPMSWMLREELGKRQPLAALSGPSFAADIVAGHPVGLTLASRRRRLLRRLQTLLNTADFDVKYTTDLIGVEMCGALKNVFAIVAGMFEGCGLGASLGGDYFTRALVEIRDLGKLVGGRWSTHTGRSGLGDLVVTCSSPSRNFRFGRLYARLFAELERERALDDHEALEQAHAEVFERTIVELGTRTIEGYDTLAAADRVVRHKNLFAPIILSIYRVLYSRTQRPAELLPEIRRVDLRRRREGPRFISILLHEALPRLYYRRHNDRLRDAVRRRLERRSGPHRRQG